MLYSAQKKAIERMDLSRALHMQALLCAARYSSDAFRKSVDSLVPRSYIRFQCERFNRIVKYLENQAPAATSDSDDKTHIPNSVPLILNIRLIYEYTHALLQRLPQYSY